MAQNPHRSQPEVRRAISKTGAGPIGATKFAQRGPSSGISAKKLAQQAQKRRIWGVVSAQGELFRAQGPAHGNFATNDTSAATDVDQHETTITTAHP